MIRECNWLKLWARAWMIPFGPLCPGSITVGMITTKHALQAIALFFAPAGVMSTINMHALVTALDGLPHKQILIACGLLICCACASTAMHNRKLNHLVVCLLLLPQQLVLSVVGVSTLATVIAGAYADGYSPNGGGWFIYLDQTFRLIVPVFYTAALIARSRARELGYDK